MVDRVVDRSAANPERLQPRGAVSAQPAVEERDELLGPVSRPVPAVEELVLQPPEEPLHGRVVRAGALARHRPRHAVLGAYGLPPVPAVMASAVAVEDRVLPLGEGAAGDGERCVRELGGGARRYRPAHRLGVEQVHHGRQVHPPAVVGQRELGDVGDPLLVGPRGAEVVGAAGGQLNLNLNLKALKAQTPRPSA